MSKDERLLHLLQQHLAESENVERSVSGVYETKILGTESVRNGILAATNRRLVFYAKKLTGYEMESFPYENISSFERGKNMMGGTVKFVASGNSVTMKWIKDSDLVEFCDLVQSRMGKPQSAATDATVQGIPEQIAALAALRDSGILTEDEFLAKKSDLLSRM